MAQLKLNDPAPDFELPNQKGKNIRLKDFRGKHVVFWFYPRARTPQ